MNIEELKRQKLIHNLSDKISDQELQQLQLGMPIQKIIGFINFDNLQINVNRNVLIPRYETEEVVRHALPFIAKHTKVLDLCCGSGYIGLTIKQKTDADVTCSDIDPEAILQTQENAQLNKLDVNVVKSNLFENIQDQFDIIVCNPPYIPSVNELDKSVLDFEPHHALIAGKDGNDIYRRIMQSITNHLQPHGVIIFEISPDNAAYLKSQGFEILKDINQKERIAIKKF